ncbi:MAG TPA: T9SS type A sorting domain-containing protein, partial [Cytophagales bacterium]|nr:T9SS type A sorting domain-containing protein [Cytophagales bacterium]
SQAYGPSTFLPKDTSKPHFLFIVADPQLTIDEISEVNNTTMIKVDKFTSRPEDMDPDFVVDSVHTLFSSSEHKKPLDTLHYQVYLGDLNETFPFVTSFTAYLSKDNAISADDNNLGTTFHNYYLAHFNGIDTGFEIPFGTVAGDYHVILKADPEDYVTESDESNNTFSMPIHIYPSDKADVSIMNIQASPQLWQYGQIASVKTLLSNTGFSTANNYKIALYLEQDRTALTGNFSQRLVPYYVSSALNKPIYMGDTASQLLWVGATPDKIAKGSYYLGLCYQDLSGEEYTHNNCAVATHMVTVTETDPTAINDAILSDLVLYPNPVADLLNIEISASIDDITLFDLVGNTVLVQRKRMHQLDLSHLSAGVYQARITLSDGNFAIKMIVKK